MFIMRFDMRSPATSPADSGDLYAVALDTAGGGEQYGCLQLIVSGHHGCEDGYPPAPLILAAATARRTRTTATQCSRAGSPDIRFARDHRLQERSWDG